AALDCYQQQIQGAGGVGPIPDIFGDAEDYADAPEEEDEIMQDDVFNDSKPEADIAAELEQHSETMRSLHEEAKKHWLSKAENFTNARHKFHLDEEMAHTGILTKLVENDKVPPEVNAERLQELCTLEKWEDAEEEEVADMQKAFLTCVIPVADAIALFDTMHEIVLFATGKYEPTANQMKDALQRIPQSLRAGLALSRPEKYRAIKNKDWREDLGTILAVAFASLSAHWEA
ncbi:unnamed protein product, partial [Symbiodinium necroappetens]